MRAGRLRDRLPGRVDAINHPALNSAWHTIKAPRFAVTCLRGNTLCVALRDGPFPGTAGPDLLTAPRRTGPWTSKTIDPGGQLTGLACTRSRACAVVDAAGRLLVSTHPTAGPATWHLSETDLFGFNGVACQNGHSCVVERRRAQRSWVRLRQRCPGADLTLARARADRAEHRPRRLGSIRRCQRLRRVIGTSRRP